MLRSRFLSPLIAFSLVLLMVGCDQAGVQEGGSSDSATRGTETTLSATEAGASGLADTPWPRFHRDLKNSGRSEVAGPSTPEVTWTFEPGDGGIGIPSVGPNGTVYVGTGGDEGRVYALGPSGNLNWSFDPGSVSPSDEISGVKNVAVRSDGAIIFGSQSDYIYALNPDGSRKWTNRLVRQRNIPASAAIVEDGTIYQGTNGGDLYALNPDGSVKWRFDTGGRTPSAAVAEDGTVYAGAGVLNFFGGAQDGDVYAINPNGSQKWRFQAGGRVLSAPLIGQDGDIYVGAFDGKVYALTPDGSLRWTYATDARIQSSVAQAEDGTLYIGSNDGHLYSLSPSGSLNWKIEADGAVRSSPVISANGLIFFGTSEGTLYAARPDGSIAWKKDLGGRVRSPVLAGDGRLYVGAGRKLVALDQGVRNVSVDIKPQSCPNPLNTSSQGVLPVAIAGEEDFDVGEIDRSTIRLAGADPLRSNTEDVTRPFEAEKTDCQDCTEAGSDGRSDLTLKFDTQEIADSLGQCERGDCKELKLEGELRDGTPIEGRDFVTIRTAQGQGPGNAPGN